MSDVLLLCGDELNVVVDAVTCNNSLVETMFITATILDTAHMFTKYSGKVWQIKVTITRLLGNRITALSVKY